MFKLRAKAGAMVAMAATVVLLTQLFMGSFLLENVHFLAGNCFGYLELCLILV